MESYPMVKHDRNWPVRDKNGKIRKLKDCYDQMLSNSINSLGHSYQRVYLQALVFYVAVWHRTGVQHYGGMDLEEIESLDELKIQKILEYPARYEGQTYTAICNMTGTGLTSELSRIVEKSLPSLEHQMRLYRAELESRGEGAMKHPASFWTYTPKDDCHQSLYGSPKNLETWLAQRREWATNAFSAQYLND